MYFATMTARSKLSLLLFEVVSEKTQYKNTEVNLLSNGRNIMRFFHNEKIAIQSYFYEVITEV